MNSLLLDYFSSKFMKKNFEEFLILFQYFLLHLFVAKSQILIKIIIINALDIIYQHHQKYFIYFIIKFINFQFFCHPN